MVDVPSPNLSNNMGVTFIKNCSLLLGVIIKLLGCTIMSGLVCIETLYETPYDGLFAITEVGWGISFDPRWYVNVNAVDKLG